MSLADQPGCRTAEDKVAPIRGTLHAPYVGNEIPVLDWLHGGTWLFPALRCTGVTETVSMEAELILETGEILGGVASFASFASRLDRTPPGSLDANAVPVPVNGEDPTVSLDDIFGQTATFRIQLRDEVGSTGVWDLDLVLIHGKAPLRSSSSSQQLAEQSSTERDPIRERPDSHRWPA